MLPAFKLSLADSQHSCRKETEPPSPCSPAAPGTLKYADRAKEIKTHVVQNVGTVESHVADYQRIIDNLQVCVFVCLPEPGRGGQS